MHRLFSRRAASVDRSDTNSKPKSESSLSQEHETEDDDPVHVTDARRPGFASLGSKLRRGVRNRYRGRVKTLQASAAENRTQQASPLTLENWDGSAMDGVSAWKSASQNRAQEYEHDVETEQVRRNEAEGSLVDKTTFLEEKVRRVVGQRSTVGEKEEERRVNKTATRAKKAERAKKDKEAREDGDSGYHSRSSSLGDSLPKSTSSTCDCYAQDSSIESSRCTKCIRGVLPPALVEPATMPALSPSTSRCSTDTDSTVKPPEQASPTPSARHRNIYFWNKPKAPSQKPPEPIERPQSSMSMSSSLLSRASDHIKQKLRGGERSSTSLGFRPASRATSRVMTIHEDKDDLDDVDYDDRNDRYEASHYTPARSQSRFVHRTHLHSNDAAIRSWKRDLRHSPTYPPLAQHARSQSSAGEGRGPGLIAGARTCNIEFQELNDDVRGAPVPGSFPGAPAARGTARRREQDEINEMNLQYEMARSLSSRGQELGFHYAPRPGPSLLHSMSMDCLSRTGQPGDRRYAVESRMADYHMIDPHGEYYDSPEEYIRAIQRPATSMSMRDRGMPHPHRRSQSAMGFRPPPRAPQYLSGPRVQQRMSTFGGSTRHRNGFRPPGNMAYCHMNYEEDDYGEFDIFRPQEPGITSYAPLRRHGARPVCSRVSELAPVYEDEMVHEHGSLYRSRSPYDYAPNVSNYLQSHYTNTRMGHYRPSSRNTVRSGHPIPRPASAISSYHPSSSRASSRGAGSTRGSVMYEQPERVRTPLLQQVFAENFR